MPNALIEVLLQHPQGIARAQLASILGLSDRAMRQLVEITKLLAAKEGLVIGFNPLLKVYKIAQDREEAILMMAHLRARALTLLTQLKAQEEALTAFEVKPLLEVAA